jgi:hypothetical protein
VAKQVDGGERVDNTTLHAKKILTTMTRHVEARELIAKATEGVLCRSGR